MSSLLARRLIDVIQDTTVALVRRDGPDLTARQFAVLLRCYGEETEQTVRGLAAYLNVSKPGITRSLDRLVHLGLAKRSVSEFDRRSVLVQQTTKGARLFHQLGDYAESAWSTKVADMLQKGRFRLIPPVATKSSNAFASAEPRPISAEATDLRFAALPRNSDVSPISGNRIPDGTSEDGAERVWLNPKTLVYHHSSHHWYGKTGSGWYMTEREAKALGARLDHRRYRS